MKTTYIALGVIIFGLATLGALVVHNKKQNKAPLCPTDVMMCPDGTSVPRTGKDCEFGVCKQTKVEEEKASVATPLPVPQEATTTLSQGGVLTNKSDSFPKKKTEKKVSILTRIVTAAKTTVTETSNFIQGSV